MLRIAGFAIGYDEQAVGAVAKLFPARLQQRVGAPFHVIPQRRPASGLDAIDRPGQHALLAWAKRVNPVAPWEDQDADGQWDSGEPGLAGKTLKQ